MTWVSHLLFRKINYNIFNISVIAKLIQIFNILVNKIFIIKANVDNNLIIIIIKLVIRLINLVKLISFIY